MLATVIEMLVGIGGTVIYLFSWNQVLAKNSTTGLDPTDPSFRIKSGRRRGWQIIFFLGLTPYVLLLFAAIERIKTTLLSQA
jgi:hypothetical protein